MAIEVRQYVDASGRNAFERWFMGLDAAVAARIESAIYRLERGNFASMKSVGAGVLESRMDFGPGYRMYLGKDGEHLVILLAGGSKKQQQRDIARAKELWREYKARKAK